MKFSDALWSPMQSYEAPWSPVEQNDLMKMASSRPTLLTLVSFALALDFNPRQPIIHYGRLMSEYYHGQFG